MSSKKIGKFVNDNFVLLVGIPLIVGVHWGWWKLQQNPDLVELKDRKELPLFTVSILLHFLYSLLSALLAGLCPKRAPFKFVQHCFKLLKSLVEMGNFVTNFLAQFGKANETHRRSANLPIKTVGGLFS